MSNFVRPYQCKGIANNGQVLIKDIDTSEGRIQGYFAVFGNVDSDGDMIMPGAFKKSLQENISRVKHLLQHDPSKPLSSSKSGLKIKEDSTGLYFDSTITKTSWGKDTLLLYMDGVVDEHSIGYEVIKSRDSDNETVERWGKKVPVKELHQLKLWEGSTVTWGANEQALATGIKSMTKEQMIDRSSLIAKALRNGKYENEEVFDLLDIYLKQLQTSIINISPNSTAADEESPQPLEKDEDLLLLDLSLETTLFKFKSF